MTEIPPNQLIRISTKKRVLSSPLYVLAGLWRARNQLRQAQPRRVLVLEPVGLGDMVTFEPLIRELLARQYETLICTKPAWRALYPDRPNQVWLNMRIPWASSDETIKYKPSLYLAEPARGDLAAMRQAAAGATGIDTRGDIRCVLMLYWAGCRRVISLSNYLGSNVGMWPLAAELVPFDNRVRRWELNVRFLRALEPGLDVATVGRPRLNHLIARQPRRRGAFMPVAPWKGKLWPAERWQAVARELAARDWEVIALCGPNQAELAAAQTGPDVPVVECGSIEAWAREFNQCAFVVSVDSGPMHLADALDVPVIALFGQGKLPLWAPSGPRSVYLSHQDDPDFQVCHPIDANIPFGQKFMNRITVEEVLKALDRVVSAS